MARKIVKKTATKKGRGGAPTKYTTATLAKIEAALKLGATYRLACGYAGVHYDTFNEWRKAKPEFSDLVKEWEGAAAVQWLQSIEEAASDGA